MDSRSRVSRPATSFGSLTLGVVAIGVEGLVIAPVLPDIAATFAVSPARAAWAVSVYGLTVALVAPLAASAGNRFGRKASMLGGLSLFALASMVCAMAGSFSLLLFGRALCGAAAGLFLPACYAYVGDAVAYAQRGRAMGRVMAGWSLAMIVGVPAGGWMAQWWGWRAPFVALSILACACLFGIGRLPEQAATVRRMAWDRLAKSGLAALLAVHFLDVLSFYAMYTFLGAAVRAEQGGGSGDFGAYVACYGTGLLAGTLNAGLLDRFGKQRVMLLSLAGLVGIFMAFPGAIRHRLTLGLCMALWGAFQALVQTGSATRITQCCPDARGAATAWMSSTAYLAVSTGAWAGGALFSAHGLVGLAMFGAVSVALASALLSRQAGP